MTIKNASYFLFLLTFSCYVIACNTKTTGKDKTSKSSKTLLSGAGSSSDYQAISGSMKRFKAMITGSFVFYSSATGDPDSYTPWLVNNGKDSVLFYNIPVGNHHKIGHWIYHYQSLTSLMDEPLYEALTLLIPIGRDSIKAISYNLPEDFELPIKKIIDAPKSILDKVNLEALEFNDEIIYYVRKNPTLYDGELNFIPSTREGDPPHRKDFYTVSPEKMIWQLKFYDKEYTFVNDQVPMRIVKLKRINFDLLD